MNEQENSQKDKKLSLLSLIGSLFAGAFGVQTEKNRTRDFTHGKFSHFIIGGIIFAILFVLAVYALAQYVVATAGGQ
jgi:hypothetical protein